MNEIVNNPKNLEKLYEFVDWGWICIKKEVDGILCYQLQMYGPIIPMVVSSVMALLKIGGKKLVILNCGVQQD